MYDFSSSSEEDNDNEIPRRRRKMYRPRINWEFDSQFEYKEVEYKPLLWFGRLLISLLSLWFPLNLMG
jgi:hypothetical protein